MSLSCCTMRQLLIILYVMSIISLSKSKETLIMTNSESQSSESSESGETENENQCCSENGCCISLRWSGSASAPKDVPPEFGGEYYCENLDISKSGCDEDEELLDYLLLPLSSPCDLTR
eukprot:93656_1